jgi:hypothetical protein
MIIIGKEEIFHPHIKDQEKTNYWAYIVNHHESRLHLLVV